MTYWEMLKEGREKAPRRTTEDHLEDIATLLAILCDKIDAVENSIDWLTEMIKVK